MFTVVFMAILILLCTAVFKSVIPVISIISVMSLIGLFCYLSALLSGL